MLATWGSLGSARIRDAVENLVHVHKERPIVKPLPTTARDIGTVRDVDATSELEKAGLGQLLVHALAYCGGDEPVQCGIEAASDELEVFHLVIGENLEALDEKRLTNSLMNIQQRLRTLAELHRRQLVAKDETITALQAELAKSAA